MLHQFEGRREHKKKNSESVLAGEMILTVYKPAKKPKLKARSATTLSELERPRVLSEAFDACLRNGATQFTSEALFNRLILELWERRALGCLALDRREFSTQLQQRGWRYDERRHVWEVGERKLEQTGELLLKLD